MKNKLPNVLGYSNLLERCPTPSEFSECNILPPYIQVSHRANSVHVRQKQNLATGNGSVSPAVDKKCATSKSAMIYMVRCIM